MRVAVVAALLTGCSEQLLHDLPRPEDPTATVEGTTGVEVEEPVPGEPVADAGPDAEYAPLEEVTLDATGSYDPEGLEIVSTEWTLVSAPAGSTAVLDDPTRARPTFFADLAGDYVFELTVENEAGVWDSSPDTVLVTVTPLDGFYVELAWDAASDLDLHLLDGSTGFFGTGDCNFCNLSPSWGGAGAADDPSLDWDAIDGFGPETITIDDPSSGVYEVGVHYYGELGFPTCSGPCASSRATINVYLGGVKAASFTDTLDAQGQIWVVAQIEWPSGRITEIGDRSTTTRTTCF